MWASNCGLQPSSRKSQAERCSGRTPRKRRLTNCWNFMTTWYAASWSPLCRRSRSKNISRCKRTGPPARRPINQIYLQANEFGRQWENIPTAIEMYERCVSLDPSYASAWARLGRARWISNKYNLGSLEGLRAAEEAFETALRLNPNLTLAHNLYTHVQVDQGRSLDAMKRLLDRAGKRRSDAELFAGLAHVCRYCGLLQPALVAHQEARRLDPLISTSVMHTYFMLGEYERALEASGADYGYGRGLVLATLGRAEEAVSMLRQCELAKPWRLGKLYLTSLRALLEGNREQSLATSEELIKATFRDPEGMYYLARQLSWKVQRWTCCLAPSTMDFSAIRPWCATLGLMPFVGAPNSQNYCARLINCTVKLRRPFSREAAL